MADNLTPQEALEQFERTTGFRIHAAVDADGTVWWRRRGDQPIFECTIGDRCMHIDELSAPQPYGPSNPQCPAEDSTGLDCSGPAGHPDGSDHANLNGTWTTAAPHCPACTETGPLHRTGCEHSPAAPRCPMCESPDRGHRNAIDEGDGPFYCDHDWHGEGDTCITCQQPIAATETAEQDSPASGRWHTRCAEQCPHCTSDKRDWRFVMPTATGTAPCGHDWHDGITAAASGSTT